MALRLDNVNAASVITSRLASGIDKIKLNGVREYYNTPLNPDPEDTTQEAWSSDIEVGTFATNSASVSLSQNLVFQIEFPTGTKEIFINNAELLTNSSETSMVLADIPGNISYTGAGEFTLTDFTILFSMNGTTL